MYISKSVRLMSGEDCKNILESSRRNNERDGVTGFLVYAANGTFIQIIEGDAKALDTTYSRISNDSRHFQVTKLLNIAIEERLFPDWSMGFRMLDDSEAESLQGFVNLAIKDALSDLGEGPIAIDALKSIFVTNSP